MSVSFNGQGEKSLERNKQLDRNSRQYGNFMEVDFLSLPNSLKLPYSLQADSTSQTSWNGLHFVQNHVFYNVNLVHEDTLKYV